MMVKILFFGALIDVTKTDSLQLNNIAQTDELIAVLHEKYPLLCHYKFSIALNQNFINNNCDLKDSDEVALMPPFAGG
jgi:molybdopterin synthase sulfur carrier subunit